MNRRRQSLASRILLHRHFWSAYSLAVAVILISVTLIWLM
jgi:hypothetical protein